MDAILKQVRALESKFSRIINQQNKKIAQLEEDSAEYLRVSKSIYEHNAEMMKKNKYLDKIIVWFEKKFSFDRDKIPVEEL